MRLFILKKRHVFTAVMYILVLTTNTHRDIIIFDLPKYTRVLERNTHLMKKYTLSSESIDAISECASVFLTSHDVNKKDMRRLCFTIEEALLKYRDISGENTIVTYRDTVLLGQPRIIIEVFGDSFNPFEIIKDPGDLMMDSLLTGYTTSTPAWKFKNFVNTLVFYAQKETKISLLTKISIAIIIGLVLGLAARMIPGDFCASVSNDYIKPIAEIYTSLMSVMAVLITFFAIVLSITHTGDIAAVSNIGKSLINKITIKDLVFIIVFIVCLAPFEDFAFGNKHFLDVKSLFDIVIGFVPSNPLYPILNFNTAQIIIVGILFGFSILKMGNKAETVENFFSECNNIGITCNSFLNSTLIHIYVGLNVFVLTSTSNISNITGAFKIMAVTLAGYAALLIFYTIYTCTATHTKPAALIKKLMPTFIVNISSANYGASFQTSFESLLGFGIDSNYLSIGHNLCGLLYKPAHMLLFCGTSILTAHMCGMQLTLGWILTLFIMSIILSATIPCIPGAAVSGFALLFVQLGLPAEYLALAVAMNAVMDFFTVAVNGYCLQCELITGAHASKKYE